MGFAPDGKRLVSVDRDKVLAVWSVDLAGVFGRGLVLVSLQTRLIRSESSTTWGPLSVALSADGHMAAAGQRICGTVSYCRD